jgi:ATP-dependent exoDNAse (exonuclease V) beta subunit
VLAEVPFAVPDWRVDEQEERTPADEPATTERPQLDLFGGPVESAVRDGEATSTKPGGPPIVLEGVIDLAFLERGAWVIADYKTDVGADPEFASRKAAYRRQVEIYAQAWASLTGDPVKERVLFFTAQGREERW